MNTRNLLSPRTGGSGILIPALALMTVSLSTAFGQAFPDPGTEYEQHATSRLVESVQKRINEGKTRFSHDGQYGYLADVLKAFGIPVSSQLLVFSKTSQFRDHINPENPRAVYFNDKVYVAWVPGTPYIELAAVEPDVGSVFYILDQTLTEKPKFVRNNQCLECHTSVKNLGVPGPLVRSFPTDKKGAVNRLEGLSRVTHSTPLKYRWGGWYATGDTGAQMHLGNIVGKEEYSNRKKPKTVTNLSEFLDTSKYPGASSDVVSIMVLEHQAFMHNLITRLHLDSVTTLKRDGNINAIRDEATAFLKYLLLVDEAPLKGAIKGNTDFADWFQNQGPRDTQGRSLRTLDLKTRLFKYPCSYLIYSDSFTQLHPFMKKHLFRRLHSILNGSDKSKDFAALDTQTRKDIKTILTATLKDLPEFWDL